MASNKHLGLFFTSAAAVGGLYLLYRSFSGEARANPRRYSHRKSFDAFSHEEKKELARRYKEDMKSIVALAKEFGTTAIITRQVLEDQGCEIRDSITAGILANKIVLDDAEKEYIKAQWKDRHRTHATMQSLAEEIGVSTTFITSFLVEEGLHEIKKEKELTDEDKRILVAAKKEANREDRALPLKSIGKDLNLDHKDVDAVVVLRFFAERGLNRPSDYSGNIPRDQQTRILSYFKDGEQNNSLIEISALEKIKPNRLRSFLFYNNIIPRAAGSFLKIELDASQKDSIARLLKEGKTNKEISEYTGLRLSIISPFIRELRATQGRTGSRVFESLSAIRGRLVTRDPSVISLIMTERAKTTPTPYEKIADLLNKEKGVKMSWSTVRKIHLEELSKLKI